MEYSKQEYDQMIKDFSTFATFEKTINVNNQELKIIWPSCDKQTYAVITYDWTSHHHKIMSYFTTESSKVVLQAGGCCGLYPLLYAQIFDRVITFEPDPLNFYCLSNNCKGDKYIKMNAALSDKGGMKKFSVHSVDNVGMHSFAKGPYQYDVLTMTIDSLNLEELSLLQLDVEGHELAALKGAAKTIKKFKPIMLIEITSDEEETIKYVESMGYRIDDVFGIEKNYVFVPVT